MELIKYDSADGQREFCAYYWEPSEEPKAVIQFVHGMQEHMGRYNEAAEYFVSRGFAVAGNDHLGHGKSVAGEEDYSYFTEKEPGRVLAQDVHNMALRLKEKYPDKPLIIISHSMGTFITQRALEEFGTQAQGVVLIGTGYYPYPVLFSAKCMVNLLQLIKGERHKSRLIKSLVFGAYNKRIENPVSESAWLTRDESVVKLYDSDKECGIPFTLNAYRGLFDTLFFIQRKVNRVKLCNDVPMLFAYGDKDPVGNYGKSPEIAARQFKALGMKTMTKKYEECRHELLNELNKEDVMKDLNEWICKEVLNG